MAQCCGDGMSLVYACSGASDVGELADRVTRLLIHENFGSKTCLAAVGAGLEGYVQSGLGADENIMIDGCSVECGRQILENAGIVHTSFVLTEMGCTKGKTEVTDELVRDMAHKIREKVKADNVKAVKIVTAPGGGCSCGGSVK